MDLITTLTLYTLLVITVLGSMLLLGHVLGEFRPQWDKNQAFECGIPPTGHLQRPLPIRFFIIAISFLIFDIETAFLMSWALAYWELGFAGFAGALLFILILLLGLYYEWQQGAFNWRPTHKQKET